MANHCEKLVKRLTDKNFKFTNNSANTTSNKTSKRIHFKKNRKRQRKNFIWNQSRWVKKYIFIFLRIENSENNDPGEKLSLHLKLKLTDSIRKLSNKGLSQVNLLLFFT